MKTIELIYKNKSNKLMNTKTIGSRLINAVIANTANRNDCTSIIAYEVPVGEFKANDLGTIYIQNVYIEEDGDVIYNVSDTLNHRSIECMQNELTKAIEMILSYLIEQAETVEAPETVETVEQVEETTNHYEVETVEAAWIIANNIFPSDYELDTTASKNAGYDVYMSTLANSNNHISDLGCRLEINLDNKSINIWIKPAPEKTPAPAKKSFNKYSSFASCRESETAPAPETQQKLKIGMQFFAAPEQQYTSADTSINAEKVPTIFNTLIEKADKLNINLNSTTIFDNGCGKYPEIISEKLNNYHAGYHGRDPYNQPKNINDMFTIFAMNCTDNRVFTSSNVLNVINGLDNRTAYIDDIKKVMKSGECLYITVYEGNKSGIGKVSKKDCWQENRKLVSYIPEVESCGFKCSTKYGMIIAEKI